MESKWINRRLIRLKGYDYRQPGKYFITFKTNGKDNILGRIEIVGTGLDLSTKTMQLNKSGKIVYNEINSMDKKNIDFEFLKYAIMPDHLHLIIKINRDNKTNLSLSQIVSMLKTKTSMEIHKIGITKFQWQRSFYDEIIKTETQYDKIVEYIENNVRNWNNRKN